jgi:hypothetical protein
MTVATKLPRGYLEMSCDDYADLSLDQQRAVFKELREIVRYTLGSDCADATIKHDNPVTPVEWIMACLSVNIECPRCKGSGVYSWGACINGRMSHSGPCARCGGKGRMNFDDMRRGRAYDNYAICRAVRGDAY